MEFKKLWVFSITALTHTLECTELSTTKAEDVHNISIFTSVSSAANVSLKCSSISENIFAHFDHTQNFTFILHGSDTYTSVLNASTTDFRPTSSSLPTEPRTPVPDGASRNKDALTVVAVAIPIIFIGAGGVIIFIFLINKYTKKNTESDYWNLQVRPEAYEHDYGILNINKNVERNSNTAETAYSNPVEPDYQNVAAFGMEIDNSDDYHATSQAEAQWDLNDSPVYFNISRNCP